MAAMEVEAAEPSSTLFELPEWEALDDSARFEQANARYLTLWNSYQESKAVALSAKVNADQLFNQLERKFTSLQTAHDALNKEKQDVKGKYDAIATERDTLEATQQSLREQIRKHELEISRIQSASNETHSSLRDALDRSGRADVEVKRLNDEFTALTTKLSEMTSKNSDLERQVHELTGQNGTLTFERSKLEREKEIATKQNEWLENELKTKNDAVAALRKEKSGEVYSLNLKAEECASELAKAEAAKSSLQARLDEQAKELSVYIDRVKTLREEGIQASEQSRNELAVQGRLIDLHKTMHEESSKKVDELQASLTSLEALLQATKSEHEDAVAPLKAELEQARSDLFAAKEELSTLQGEAIRANVDLTGITDAASGTGAAASTAGSARKTRAGQRRQRSPGKAAQNDSDDEPAHADKRRKLMSLVSPTAAVASLMQEGVTVTDLYTQLSETKNDLSKQKSENKRLTNYLNQILKEIERKAPLIREERYRYDQAVESHSQLTRDLEEVVIERGALSREREDLLTKLKQVNLEKELLSKSKGDLSRQVQLLLKECVEHARGESLEEPADNAADPITGDLDVMVDADAVITERLVTFRNIQEIQIRNRELLAVVRKLSAEKENFEREELAKAKEEFASQLKLAMSEIESLKTSRAEQHKLVSNIVRQRDMYRALVAAAERNGPVTVPDVDAEAAAAGGVKSAVSPAKPAVGSTDASAQRALAMMGGEAQEDTPDYLQVLADVKAEYEGFRKEVTAERKEHHEALDKLRDELFAARTDLAKAEAKADYERQRHDLLIKNSEQQAMELQNLRNKNLDFSQSLINHQRRLDEALGKLDLEREHGKAASIKLTGMVEQQKLWKLTEKRLMDDKEDLVRQRDQQRTLIESLQTMQQNLETSETQAKRRLTNEVETLQKQWISAQKQLEDERQFSKEQIARHEKDLRELREKNEQRQTELQKLRESETKAQTDLVAATELKKQLEGQISLQQARIDALSARSATSAASGGAGGETTLEGSELELANVREELRHTLELHAQAKADANQYKRFAEDREKALAELSAASDDFKVNMQKQLDESKDESAKLKTTVASLEESIKAKESASESLKSVHEEELQQVQKRLSDSQGEVARLEKQLEGLPEREAGFKQDIRKQAELVQQAQENYEREMMLHAEALKTLNATKETLSDCQRRLNKAEEQVAMNTANQTAIEASWEGKVRELENQVSQLTEQNEDYQSQYRLVLNQLELVTQQLLKAQRHAADTAPAAAAGTGVEADSTTEGGAEAISDATTIGELREVIRFLRRDKELAETKLELAQQETARHEAATAQAQRLLSETKEQLADERARSQAKLQSPDQHAELLEKVKQHSLLSESNQLLRDKNEKYLKDIQRLEAEVKALQGRIAPLEQEKQTILAEKDAIEANLAVLQKQLEHWKGRVQILQDKFQHVDPEAYRELKEEAAKTSQELEEQKAKAAELEKDKENLNTQISTLEKQATESANQIHKFKRAGLNYQNKCKALEEEVATLKASQSNDQQAATTEHKKELETLRTTLQSQIDAAKKEVEVFKGKLTNAVQRIKTDKAKIKELTTELEALKAAGAELDADLMEEDGNAANATATAGTAPAQPAAAAPAATEPAQPISFSTPAATEATPAADTGAAEGEAMDEAEPTEADVADSYIVADASETTDATPAAETTTEPAAAGTAPITFGSGAAKPSPISFGSGATTTAATTAAPASSGPAPISFGSGAAKPGPITFGSSATTTAATTTAAPASSGPAPITFGSGAAKPSPITFGSGTTAAAPTNTFGQTGSTGFGSSTFGQGTSSGITGFGQSTAAASSASEATDAAPATGTAGQTGLQFASPRPTSFFAAATTSTQATLADSTTDAPAPKPISFGSSDADKAATSFKLGGQGDKPKFQFGSQSTFTLKAPDTTAALTTSTAATTSVTESAPATQSTDTPAGAASRGIQPISFSSAAEAAKPTGAGATTGVLGAAKFGATAGRGPAKGKGKGKGKRLIKRPGRTMAKPATMGFNPAAPSFNPSQAGGQQGGSDQGGDDAQ